MKTFKQFLNERLSSVKQTKLIDSEEICNASFNSNYIKVRELLEEGYNPNYKDSDNWTPLTIACKYTSDSEYYETAKVLLEYGADANLVGGANESTPLAFVCNMAHSRSKIAELLFKYGANPNIKNKAGWTPMSIIARDNLADLFEIFKKNGADPKIKDKNGETALDIAKRYNNKEFIEYFG